VDAATSPDSAQLPPLAPDARPGFDLGSGAGFPGMVIAISCPPTSPGARPLPSIATAQNARFCAKVARATGAPAEFTPSGSSNRPESLLPVDAVVAALRPLPRLSNWPMCDHARRGWGFSRALGRTQLRPFRAADLTIDILASKLDPEAADSSGAQPFEGLFMSDALRPSRSARPSRCPAAILVLANQKARRQTTTAINLGPALAAIGETRADHRPRSAGQRFDRARHRPQVAQSPRL